MRLVVLESPYSAPSFEEVTVNEGYARACLLDSLNRNEAPVAFHLLYTQVLDDRDRSHRARGISAGHRWFNRVDAVVVYTDRGISSGMLAGIKAAELRKIPVEYRKLNGAST